METVSMKSEKVLLGGIYCTVIMYVCMYVTLYVVILTLLLLFLVKWREAYILCVHVVNDTH